MSRAEEVLLVEFFRGQGAVLGQEGDDHHRTPAQQAIHSMRELLRMRAEISRARNERKMRPAIPERCDPFGHEFYRQQGTDTGCPYCLKLEADKMRTTIEGARLKIAGAWEDLRRPL